MNEHPLITCNPNILFGKPTIAGTRISVELILENLGAGETVEQILENYPHLNRDRVLAAIRYATEVFRNELPNPYRQLTSLTPPSAIEPSSDRCS